MLIFPDKHTRPKNKKVFVAMSGGVDSSVAAFLLQKEGYDVTGVFMRCFNLDGCAERDAEDARRVAAHLGIPFYVFDFEEEYKRKVVDYMVEGYRRGETPNPDVMCNKEIKFGLFLKKALALGADYIATGHYVRIRSSPDTLTQDVSGVTPKSYPSQEYRASLYAARDTNKDQSYFLWTLIQDQLKYCFFPIGDYLKVEVREIARKAGLPTAEKKDSRGICFLGRVTLKEFLKQYIPESPGAVITTTGKVIGEHGGAHFYTIGQRHGLALGMKNKGLGIKGLSETKPYYIAEKDIKTNTLVVADGDDDPALYRREVKLKNVNLVNLEIKINNDKLSFPVLARVRYRQPLAPALFVAQSSFHQLVFDQPVKFVAPGQSAVFYSKEGEVLGGGIIES